MLSDNDLSSEYGSAAPCDYCNEKKSFLMSDVEYYNYGFNKRDISICKRCSEEKHKIQNRPPHLIAAVGRDQIYEEICEAIKTKSRSPLSDRHTPVNYYDAVKAAYQMNGALRRYLRRRSQLDDLNKIDKNLDSLWRYTYKIANDRDERITVVNKNPDNFLVSWAK